MMKQISYNDKNKYAFRFSTDVLQLRTYGAKASTYGAKAPHIWSWGLAHMELMVDIYSIKGLTPYNT